MLNPVLQNNNVSFYANLNSRKLRFSQKDFFIKIRGYGKNTDWANQVIKTTDDAVEMIRNKQSAESVLKKITSGVVEANKHPFDIAKRTKTGVLRTYREGWNCSEEREIYTAYEKGRYKSYASRFDERFNTPLLPLSNDIGLSVPTRFQDIHHGGARLINNSLDYIFKLFKNKYLMFTQKDVKSNDLDKIIDVVAEVRWVLAHATPWLRGSDAISNVFMRAMFKAVGVKSYPSAKGVSFDLEAYCRNLDDYKANFVSFFEKPPVVVE